MCIRDRSKCIPGVTETGHNTMKKIKELTTQNDANERKNHRKRGLYEAMLEAREQGKIRFIGLTNHRLNVAEEAVRSGLYDTLQFPFCYRCV